MYTRNVKFCMVTSIRENQFTETFYAVVVSKFLTEMKETNEKLKFVTSGFKIYTKEPNYGYQQMVIEWEAIEKNEN